MIRPEDDYREVIDYTEVKEVKKETVVETTPTSGGIFSQIGAFIKWANNNGGFRIL